MPRKRIDTDALWEEFLEPYDDELLGNFDSAREKLRELAGKGNANAAFLLGALHYNDRDNESCLECWQQAAELGHSRASAYIDQFLARRSDQKRSIFQKDEAERKIDAQYMSWKDIKKNLSDFSKSSGRHHNENSASTDSVSKKDSADTKSTDSGKFESLIRRHFRPSAFLLGLYTGLWIPDIDQALLFLLHHRSILTHSVLIPFLIVMFSRKPSLREVGAGVAAGISIHLAADCLSPMKGFSLIYFPWPIKESIGSGASLVWILCNAIAGLWIALSYSSSRLPLIIFLVCTVGLSYALFNEEAIWPFVIFGLILTLLTWRKLRNKKPEIRNSDNGDGR